MEKKDLKKIKLPDTPGVYFFRGARGKVLYIGKATSLRNRVKSYFTRKIVDTRGPGIAKMIEETKKITFTKTDSVLEALILEANLIKKYQPKYNVKEKSDKSFHYIAITKEDFPRVLLIRERELLGGSTPKRPTKQAKTRKKKLPDMQYTLGPFPQGGVLREALKIVRKIFPFRDKCLPAPSAPSVARQAGTLCTSDGRPTSVKLLAKCKPCFNRQINLCPGVCSGDITKTEYRKTINNLKLFFEGKKKRLIKKLEKEMNTLAKKQNFEKALKLKKTIFALQHIQDISLLKTTSNNYPQRGLRSFRIEGYDIAHISGTSMVGVMTVMENGEIQKSAYRKFKIKTVKGVNDTASLKEVLERRFGHPEWKYPKLIVIDGGKAQKNIAEKILNNLGIEIPIVSVVKDERHKPKDILGLKTFLKNVSPEHSVLGDKKNTQKYAKDILLVNNESHRFAINYHKQLRGKI